MATSGLVRERTAASVGYAPSWVARAQGYLRECNRITSGEPGRSPLQGAYEAEDLVEVMYGLTAPQPSDAPATVAALDDMYLMPTGAEGGATPANPGPSLKEVTAEAMRDVARWVAEAQAKGARPEWMPKVPASITVSLVLPRRVIVRWRLSDAPPRDDVYIPRGQYSHPAAAHNLLRETTITYQVLWVCGELYADTVAHRAAHEKASAAQAVKASTKTAKRRRNAETLPGVSTPTRTSDRSAREGVPASPDQGQVTQNRAFSQASKSARRVGHPPLSGDDHRATYPDCGPPAAR